jgi:hypothetical protein
MDVDTSPIIRGGKTYTRHLLRESYRTNGQVLHRPLAHLRHGSAAEIEAMRLARRHKPALFMQRLPLLLFLSSEGSQSTQASAVSEAGKH